ncbi:MAG: TonB-dependent receptor, partial [Dehalococcoidia bacterium]|nr:TonB-dependent receptor [Dehalococcoidia bacterium]
MMTTTRSALRALLLATAALPAMGMATPASAQEPTAIEEVIVTAQRRSESLQNVPIAVTAVTAEQLAAKRVDSVAGVARISPSISFDVSTSAATAA